MSPAIGFPVIDAHCHFFPERMFAAIWNYFESGGWKVNRGTLDTLAQTLRDHGVSNYAVLNYVSGEGKADDLNRWTRGFCGQRPEALPFCAVHVNDPDPWSQAAPYLLDHGFHGIKIQPLVCGFGVDHPRLRPTLRRLAETGKILFAHAGTAPYATPLVGLDRMARVLEDLPELKTIIAHMGAFESERAIAMAARYPSVFLDTAMIFVNTDLFNTNPELPVSELMAIQDRILFGSDFPNFPYSYSEALDSINRLSLPDSVKKKIFHDNAAALFEISTPRPTTNQEDPK